MSVDYSDPKMAGYEPLEVFQENDQDHSSRTIRDEIASKGIIFDSKTEVTKAKISSGVQYIELLGEFFPGDTPRTYYKRAEVEPAHANKLKAKDNSWWERVLVETALVSITEFGASVNKSAVDNDIAIQTCFNFCRDNNRTWLIPDGHFRVSNLVTYTSGYCYGKLIADNNGSDSAVLLVAPRAEDLTNFTLDQMNAWTFMAKGASEHADMIPYSGHVVWWRSNDEFVIKRLGSPTQITLREAIVVNEEGKFYPAVRHARTVPTWTSASGQAVRIRDKVVIHGLKIDVTTGTTQRGVLVHVQRPNTTIRDCDLINKTSGTIAQGFVVDSCGLVTFDNCYVEGLGDSQTNYGWNFGACADIAILNCRESKNRRGVDGHGSKQVTITGGSFPDGVGAHWAYDYRITDAYLSADYTNSAPVHYAGADLTVEGCRIRVQSESQPVINSREDFFEISGAVRLDRNNIEIDVRDAFTVPRCLIDLEAGNSTDNMDWNRIVYYPDLISIQDNRIRQIGASYTAQTELTVIGSGKTFLANGGTGGSSGGGKIIVRGNQELFDGGDTSTRWILSINKSKEWKYGSGYDVFIEDLSSLQIYAYCAPERTDNDQRSNFYVDRVDTLFWQASFGVFKFAYLNVLTMGVNLGSGRPSSGRTTAVGDEKEVRRPTQRLVDSNDHVKILSAAGIEQFRIADTTNSVNHLIAQASIAGAAPGFQAIGSDSHIGIDFKGRGNGGFLFASNFGANKQFLVSPVANAVNYPVASGGIAGAPAKLWAFGTDTHVDLQLDPRGTGGRVRFGTHAASADAAINGYIEIKDAAGNIRKLATIA